MADRPKINDYYLDHVGRRRKLSHGAILRIQQQFAKGAKTADLAAAYEVSVSLIRTITYSTPRDSDIEKLHGKG